MLLRERGCTLKLIRQNVRLSVHLTKTGNLFQSSKALTTESSYCTQGSPKVKCCMTLYHTWTPTFVVDLRHPYDNFSKFTVP